MVIGGGRTKAIIIALSAALVFASLAIVPQLATTTTARQSGDNGDARRIVAFDLRYDHELQTSVMTARQVKMGDLQPNEASWFLSPFSRDMHEFHEQEIDEAPPEKVSQFFAKTEAYSRYNLIRLPEFLGGGREDISSYRAYSAMAVSNSCGNKYFSTRYAIEDPCHGDRHRPWDGLAVSGPAAAGLYSHSLIGSPRLVALPHLDLAVDGEGYIVAKRPDPSVNGVVGQGRSTSLEEGEDNSRQMFAAASAYAGYALPFPQTLAGSRLVTVEPAEVPGILGFANRDAVTTQMNARYHDPKDGWSRYVEVNAYPVDQFPDLTRGATPEQPLNMTTVAAFQNLYEIKTGLNIAGRQQQQDVHVTVSQDGTTGAAAILGKSADGTTLLMTVRVEGRETDIGEVEETVRTILTLLD